MKTSFSEYYKGPIYSSKWIVDSIQQGKCLNKDDYFVCINIDERSRMLNIGKKKKYTVIEGIKLYEMITNHKNLQINNTQFWLKAQKQAILPERSADSMKNFWKKNEYKTLEEFLIECIHEGTDFCLSFKQIPNPQFVRRFKQQYANEFLKLQTLERLGEDEEEGVAAGVKAAGFGNGVKNLGRQIIGSGQSAVESVKNTTIPLKSLLETSLKEEPKSH